MNRIELAIAESKRVDALTGAHNPKIRINARSVADVESVRDQWSKMDSIPFGIPNRDAAVDNGFPGLDVRTFLSGDDSSGRLSVHDILVPPGGGLPAHCLEHCDLFFHVIEGTPSLTVGTLSEVSRPSTFGYVPPETTFSVLNESDKPARLLCIFNPAGVELGFAEAHDHWVRTGDARPETYREILARYGFRFDLDGPLPNDARVNLPLDRLDVRVESFEDFEALRTRMSERPPVPRLIYDLSDCFHLQRRDGDKVSQISVVVGGEDTQGRAAFFLGEVATGYNAPPHFQTSEEEIFFLAEGNLTLLCGNQTLTLKPGAFGFAPSGASHGFFNPGPGLARVVTWNSPAGHERGLERMAEFVHSQKDAASMVRLMENHGWVTHSTSGWGVEGSQEEGYVNPFENA